MKIKIKFESWFMNSQALNNKFKKLFVPDEDMLTYEFVSENPDYTIVFGRTEWDKIQTSKDKTFFISQEPLWSPNQNKDSIENYCSKILISDKSFYPDKPEYIECFLPMFYAGRGEFDHRSEWDWSLKIKDSFFLEKTENISVIQTDSYQSHFWSLSNGINNRIIYKERVDIVNNLIKDFPNIKFWGTHQSSNGINTFGELWNKFAGLKNFRFSLCFENTIQKNYVSEKFWDCVLTETVPIYGGCNNITEYIDKDSFIDLTSHIDDYNYIKDKISYIEKNSHKLYNTYQPKIKKLKSEFFKNENFNLWLKIKTLF